MKKKTMFLALILGILAVPGMEVQAASTGSASILMITSLETTTSYNDIALSGDGHYLLVSTGDSSPGQGNITLIEIPTSFSSETVKKWVIQEESPNGLSINTDGSRIVYVDENDEILYCMSSESVTPTWTITLPYEFRSLGMSENGDYIAYVTDDATDVITLVAGADKTQLWTFDAGATSVNGLDISNDGKVIVGFTNHSIAYFNTAGKVWQRDMGAVCQSICISNDGETVLVSPQSATDNITLYDGAGTQLLNVEGTLWSTGGMALAKDAGVFIAATYDSDDMPGNAIKGFTTTSAAPTWAVTTGIRHNKVAISNNGKTALVTDYAYNVKIVDMAEGTVITTHDVGAYIKRVAVSDDGTVGAAIAGYNTVLVYGVTPSSGIWDQFLGTVTDLDNIYGLGAAALVGLLLGGLIFGLGKKRKA